MDFKPFVDFLIDKNFINSDQFDIAVRMRDGGLIDILEQGTSKWKMALKYLRRARMIAQESHCYSRKVGAIIVDDKGIDIRTGYNGPPRNFPHCEHRHPDGKKECPRRYQAKIEGREFISGENAHMCPASHAERNAIYLAANTHVSVRGANLHLDTFGLPCQDCANAIVQSGVAEVTCLSFKEYRQNKDAIKAMEIFYYAGVRLSLFMENNLLDGLDH